jgi:hypothetical protein
MPHILPFTIFSLLQNLTYVEIFLIIIVAYMMQDNKNIIVDLDNTLLYFKFPYIGEPIDGSVEAINTLTDMGYKITIYSCRNNPKLFSSTVLMNQNLNDTEAALKKYGFKEFTIDKGDTGKPCALYYVDDSGIEFDRWETVISVHNFHSGMSIAIGIENCILDESNNLIESTADALDFFRVAGVKVILTSIRSNTQNADSKTVDENMAEIEEILKGYQVYYNYLDYCNRGKPVCNYYIEPNMIFFHGSWGKVLKRIIEYKES